MGSREVQRKMPLIKSQPSSHPPRLHIYLCLLRYFCGPDARKTAKQALQQKKRPRAKQAEGAEPGEGSEASGSGSEESEEDDAPVKGALVVFWVELNSGSRV